MKIIIRKYTIWIYQLALNTAIPDIVFDLITHMFL